VSVSEYLIKRLNEKPCRKAFVAYSLRRHFTINEVSRWNLL